MADLDATWDLYRTFLAVMREGNLSGAARHLGLAQPTVGRQIERLEEELGVSLFVRSPRGLVANAIAYDLVPHVETMATSAAALVRTASGETAEESGTIRLTAGEYVGLEVLPQILAAIALRYPRIDLELSLTNRNEDMLQRDADIAVRMVCPTQKALVARRIGVVKIGLFAHRRYVDIAGLPKTPADLPNHCFIGFDRDFSILQSQGGWAAKLRREDFRFRTDHVGAQIAALRMGMGIAACHKNMARLEPNLIPVLEDSVQFEREMWLVMHENAKRTHRIKMMFDSLAEGLIAYLRGESRSHHG